MATGDFQDKKLWREYEQRITEYISQKCGPNATVDWNASRVGRLSGEDRQIDVWVEGIDLGFIQDGTAMFDCKHVLETPGKRPRKVSVGVVESFIAMVEDVGADFGVLVSNVGFTRTATARVQGGIRLKTIPWAQLGLISPTGGVHELLVPLHADGYYVGDFVDQSAYETGVVAIVSYGSPSGEDRLVSTQSDEDLMWGETVSNRLVARAILIDYLNAPPEEDEIDQFVESFESRLLAGQPFYITVEEIGDSLGVRPRHVRTRWYPEYLED